MVVVAVSAVILPVAVCCAVLKVVGVGCAGLVRLPALPSSVSLSTGHCRRKRVWLGCYVVFLWLGYCAPVRLVVVMVWLCSRLWKWPLLIWRAEVVADFQV